MARKPTSLEQVEKSEFRAINPEDVKQTVEIAVKPKPKKEDIEIIEPQKKTKARKGKLKKDGYILVITEKPQAASKIASALAEGKENKITNNQKVPYYELERNGKQLVVGCAVGHLFTVSQKKKGTEYPIFDIGWFPNSEVKRNDFSKKYFDVIKKLVKNANEIVIATDFDIEGEVIGYNITRFIANQPDAKRMKFSSLTPKELQDAFDNRNDHIEWGQAIAGETRHFLDWIYGINLSRALMQALKKTGRFSVMSIGRVQGPTLNLIVEKEKQIQAFKPTAYWQIFITINDGKNKLELKHNKDITKKADLDKFKKLKGKKADAETKKTKQTITPPAPFDLTSLQTEAYKFHSITPASTLQVAQKLYLAGLISYPRTSSQKITDKENAKKVLERLKEKFPETKYITKDTPIEGNKSDPAHPAIIPTGIYQKLKDYDEKIYNLIVKRFISCYCDSAELDNKKVTAEFDKLKFSEKGMGILKKGWLNVYPAKMVEKEIADFSGEVDIENVKTEEKETKPPKRYSPASIVSELEKRNLGTKATRANIIETLYDRKYIKEKSIKATNFGIQLIDSLKKYSPIIIEEQLTREIEKDMNLIRISKKDLEKKEQKIIEKAKKALIKISEDFKKNEEKIGLDLKKANEEAWAQEKEDNKLSVDCPSCKTGKLNIKYTPRFKSYFVACTNYPDCKQTFPLPSQSLIKKTDKDCEECNWPMLLRIKTAKRPWIFCFNPNCPTRKELDLAGNTKKRTPRFIGKSEEIKEKSIEKV